MANIEYKPPQLKGEGYEVAIYNMAGELHEVLSPFDEERMWYHFEKLVQFHSFTFSVVAYKHGAEIRREKGKGKF